MSNCEFYYTDENGICLQCIRPTCGGITRGIELCNTHYQILKKDNLVRVSKDIEIPNNPETIIKVSKRCLCNCKKTITKPIVEPYVYDYDYKDVEVIVENE